MRNSPGNESGPVDFSGMELFPRRFVVVLELLPSVFPARRRFLLALQLLKIQPQSPRSVINLRSGRDNAICFFLNVISDYVDRNLKDAGAAARKHVTCREGEGRSQFAEH